METELLILPKKLFGKVRNLSKFNLDPTCTHFELKRNRFF